ncbi:MAG: hypothetical protein IH872_06065 [Chloroflexi bacterium]|nr:hypothetical protein [Chloroflexota bacterium]
MLDNLTIPRRSATAAESSYEALREEGIKLVQDLSGELWTDYNLHDPGVTILEQLCYALTDLIHRTERDMPDHLTSPNGLIDFENQALVRPESVFPSCPLTVSDYRKLMIDGVPELDNAWVFPVTGDGPKGLYRIYAQLAESDDGKEVEPSNSRFADVAEKIRDVYAANRNLGEDLADVRIVESGDCWLQGVIETEGNREPSDVLAEIYFRASQLIASSISSSTFEEAVDTGKSIDEIFTGPLTIHAYIDGERLETIRESITIADMIEAVSGIDGVRYVERLWFRDDQGNDTQTIRHDPLSGRVPRLRLPTNASGEGIILRSSGRELAVSLRDIRWGFDRRKAEYRTRRQTVQDFEELLPMPVGNYQDLGSYYSIQEQFPDTYGINRYGLPVSAAPARKAQAKNLKAYLWFFEQIMANFQENLAQYRRLFSLDHLLNQSYFHQMIKPENMPDVDRLYQGDLEQTESDLSAVVERHDNFGYRRNRILDFLLAIYGERFSPDPFMLLDIYSDLGLDHELIGVKIELLKAIG